MSVRVYLGTHLPNWLGLTSVPLFVSRRRLAGKRKLPRARGPWALDSGGFSELQLYGGWRTSAAQYAREVQRYMEEIGNLDWAAIQDWMCEPQVIAGLLVRENPKAKRKPSIDLVEWKRWVRRLNRERKDVPPVVATLALGRRRERAGERLAVLFHGTGLSIEEHQRRTVASYLELKRLAPEVPWAPVLQGFKRDDYFRHLDMYIAAGVDLWAAPVVGVGSVCRRQDTAEAEAFIRELASLGLRLHGFGFKAKGLPNVHDVLQSSDSLAWSMDARRAPPLPGCIGHKNCANCLRYALRWLDHLHARLEQVPQLSLAPEATRTDPRSFDALVQDTVFKLARKAA